MRLWELKPNTPGVAAILAEQKSFTAVQALNLSELCETLGSSSKNVGLEVQKPEIWSLLGHWRIQPVLLSLCKSQNTVVVKVLDLGVVQPKTSSTESPWGTLAHAMHTLC